MPTIYYRTGYFGPYALKIPDTLDVMDEADHDEVAELCARDFHSNHDGFESAWPREFTLHLANDGPVLATVNIELDHEPVFTATSR